MLKFKIRKCPKCHRYTLKKICPYCGSETLIAHPAKFSPDDRYLEYKVLSILRSKGYKI